MLLLLLVLLLLLPLMLLRLPMLMLLLHRFLLLRLLLPPSQLRLQTKRNEDNAVCNARRAARITQGRPWTPTITMGDVHRAHMHKTTCRNLGVRNATRQRPQLNCVNSTSDNLVRSHVLRYSCLRLQKEMLLTI